MVLFNAAFDIATERSLTHFFAAPMGRSEVPSEASTQVWKVFFTNDVGMSIEVLLGEDYSPEYQRLFDGQGYVSVEDMAILFTSAGNGGGD